MKVTSNYFYVKFSNTKQTLQVLYIKVFSSSILLKHSF